jgi:hypothetical protein
MGLGGLEGLGGPAQYTVPRYGRLAARDVVVGVTQLKRHRHSVPQITRGTGHYQPAQGS